MESKACLWLGTKHWIGEIFKIYIFKMDFSLTSTFELSFNCALLQTLISRNLFSGLSFCILQNALARGAAVWPGAVGSDLQSVSGPSSEM